MTEAVMTENKMTETEMLQTIYAGMQDMKQEMQNMKVELRQEMQDMKVELRQEMQNMKVELRQEMQDMKTELRQEMNQHVQKINERFDVLELRQKKTKEQLDDLSLDVKLSERNTQKSIHHLNDQMETVIEILKQNNMVGIA